LSQRRLTVTLVGSFAVLALALAALGIYGVLAFGVAARTRELGIRRALGASARSVRVSVLRRGLLWSLSGLAIGSVAAALCARWMRSTLYGVTPFDAATYATAGAALLVVAVLACVVPARRAVRVDPLIAMRSE
jgi:ABC-type antimicrobial peptide transport system permease subunit